MDSSAQQAGTPGYNTVFLPAHGVGDTRQREAQWGAFAAGSVHIDSWVNDAPSESEARERVLFSCAEKGGKNCEVQFVFSGTCVAVVASPTELVWRSHDASARKARKVALRDCGSDCVVVNEGCAFPQ